MQLKNSKKIFFTHQKQLMKFSIIQNLLYQPPMLFFKVCQIRSICRCCRGSFTTQTTSNTLTMRKYVLLSGG